MNTNVRPISLAVAMVLASAFLAATGANAQSAGVPAGAIRGLVDDDERHEAPPPVAAASAQAKAYSPYAGRTYPTRVLWGDTHLHSTNSGDALTAGTRFTPEQAYRISRGEEVVSTTGLPARLPRPLDFVVVSDHSEALGLMTEVLNLNPVLMADPTLKRWAEMINAGGEDADTAVTELIGAQANNTIPPLLADPKVVGPLMMSVWQRATAMADKYNEPGKFTTIIGFEWTPTPGGDNLHRNVLLRDGKDRAQQVFPFTSWESGDPEQLWNWMEAYEKRTGGRALAIPHNANLSNGRMFAAETLDGTPLTAAYAERRRRFEPLQEIVQTKGASESHTMISPNDEFLEYGLAGWELGNLTLDGKPLSKDMMPTGYLRTGLMRGLEHEAKLGVNPFKFGIVGSSDTHHAMPFVEEDNFFGKFPAQEPRADRWKQASSLGGDAARFTWQYLAAGYAAVWATENTREAIFDAMMRRETYGTSGTRMTVRMFGGYDYRPEDAQSRYLVDVGYTKGVPMGGDLKRSPSGAAPTFLLAAMKDPNGANLDRIQVIKGWLDESGTAQERVYDVVWSGDRQIGRDGKLPSVGDTVDVARATFTNTIGAAELTGVWKDPDFKPSQRAFYYTRVIEIPTPRWTAYDQVRFGVKMSDEVPMKQQERAWSSPIWYTP
ncbi:MAG: DUF3604 domain-containing protein [Arenimonas sp.]|nr:DUF3604 domain-containing protein [Arenimonas sp.]